MALRCSFHLQLPPPGMSRRLSAPSVERGEVTGLDKHHLTERKEFYSQQRSPTARANNNNVPTLQWCWEVQIQRQYPPVLFTQYPLSHSIHWKPSLGRIAFPGFALCGPRRHSSALCLPSSLIALRTRSAQGQKTQSTGWLPESFLSLSCFLSCSLPFISEPQRHLNSRKLSRKIEFRSRLTKYRIKGPCL